MPHWLRYEFEGREGFGILEDIAVLEHQGDLFAAPAATGRRLPLAALRLLPPCRPRNFIGLWNNFAERAAKEGLRRPDHPLYFLKGANSHAAHGDPIPRPAGYAGHVVFEAEIQRRVGVRGGDDVPRRAATAQVVERGEAARQVIGRVEGRRAGGDR